jgi:hypothetical protein
MIFWRSDEGMEEGGMKRLRIRKERSGNERPRQVVAQSEGRVGIRSGM